MTVEVGELDLTDHRRGSAVASPPRSSRCWTYAMRSSGGHGEAARPRPHRARSNASTMAGRSTSPDPDLRQGRRPAIVRSAASPMAYCP
ncbi:hypothetical protein NL676_035068 [Syzygium grande]|nr:hypothetical protein NL676_035068 [Syzygium grande]